MLSTLEFASKIAWMRAELRDLKTAHTRGLGLIDFFSDSVEISAELLKIYKLTVKIADSYADVFPPLVQVAVEPWAQGGVSYLFPTFDQSTLTFTVVLGSNWNNGDQIKVSVVSSAKIQSLNLEVYNA